MKYLYIITCLCCISSSFSQNDSIQTTQIDSIFIQAIRVQEPWQSTPMAITKLDISETQNIKQQLSLNDYLQSVPGLFVQNANNFSQDMRVSVRGFGSRSAFGIRGVKLLVDGIPETTPDGQGQIDNLNLSVLKTIEVIRGPSAALYGNASGGVISINTLDTVDSLLLKGAVTAGSFNFQRFQVTSGFKAGRSSYIIDANHTTTDGYRDQSGFSNTNVNARMISKLSSKSKLNVLFNYTNSPKAEDAGGLTLEELNTNRRQARQRNVDFKTEESVRQLKVGLRLKHVFTSKAELSTYGFYSHRDFDGKLPFEFGGIIDLNRNYYGQGSQVTFKSKTNSLQLGYDWAEQRDQRLRYRNLEGVQGDQTLNQLESFSTLGLFAVDHLRLDAFLISLGARYDNNVLKADDDFLDNGDDSGRISLSSFNPSLGVNYKLNASASLFTSISTSFETPTLSELSANPTDSGGFNEALKPQKAQNLEAGFRYKNKKQAFEAVVFYIKTDDDLIPFELEAFPDRTFFRNAGSTARSGLELTYQRQLSEQLSLNTSYSFSDFRYDSYSLPSGDFSGNALPVIPKHKAYASLVYQNEKLTAQLESNYVGSLYANDANSVRVSDYTLVNLSVGYTIGLKDQSLKPFLGIQNLLNTKYNDNIRINAFGGRYYEAAPRLHVFGGVRLLF